MALERRISAVERRLRELQMQCKRINKQAKHYVQLAKHCHLMKEEWKRLLVELRQQKPDRNDT